LLTDMKDKPCLNVLLAAAVLFDDPVEATNALAYGPYVLELNL